MTFGHHNATIPLITRQHYQIRKMLEGFGCDGKIDLPIGRQFRNLQRRALVHMQPDFRIVRDELINHRRQGITCLSMGCRNTQLAFLLVPELLRDLFNAADLTQDLARFFNDLLTRWRNVGKVFAATSKNFDAELVFEQSNLFTDPGLRCEQALSRRGDIQAMPRNFPDIS